MSNNIKLPTGWTSVEIGEIVLPIETVSPADYHNEEISYLDISSIDNEKGAIDHPKILLGKDAPSRARQLVRPEDTIFSTVRPYLKAIAMVGPTINRPIASTGFCVLRACEGINSRYLFYFVRSDQLMQEIIPLQRGVSYPAIRTKDLLSRKIPTPPTNEQNRIVDKIDELFSELDAGINELKIAQLKLEYYRQSLLKNAVEGALTQKWRDDNKDKIEETGKELLNRILIERKQRWEQNKLEEFKKKGKNPPKNWQDKYPEPVQPDTTDLPELPEGWVWASISQIGWLDRGRSKHRPRNAAHLYGGKYPFVQTGEIRAAEQYIRETDKTYSEDGLAQSKLWPKGTMCITIAANIGETAILDIEACFPDSIVGFNCVIAEMPVEYVEYYFRVLKSKLNDEAPATAQKNINLEILSKEVIPLPPIKEQLTIVESLNNELESIKWQQASIKLGLNQSEAQRKNILKSAFSGQLVSQDPDDEPASVLLEKIKQEREALAKIPKPRKQSKPRKRVELMNTLLEVLTAENDWIDAQDAFQKCGIVDGTSTDRIEEIYTELRKLEKTGRIEIQRQGDFDQLKLTTQDIKED